MKGSNAFDKPLDRYITEEREIEVPSIIPVGKDRNGNEDFSIGTEKRSIEEKVYYTMAKKRILSCPKGKHFWRMIDRHKGLAKCDFCTKHRFLVATKETIKDGHIVDRDTEEIKD